jgi:hypothetical protein
MTTRQQRKEKARIAIAARRDSDLAKAAIARRQAKKPQYVVCTTNNDGSISKKMFNSFDYLDHQHDDKKAAFKMRDEMQADPWAAYVKATYIVVNRKTMKIVTR